MTKSKLYGLASLPQNDGNWEIKRATIADADEVLALYNSMIGTPGCTWSELYPAMENIEFDLGKDALWVMRDGDVLVGAISVGNLGDVCQLGWAPQNPAELARIAVAHGYQGRGLAAALIRHGIETARAAGHDGVVLLVSPDNHAARHLYEKLGFEPCGEIDGWNHHWLRYQQSF